MGEKKEENVYGGVEINDRDQCELGRSKSKVKLEV